MSRWVLGLFVAAALAGCGTIGPPIAPEDIGVAARLQKEKEREAKEKAAKEAPKLEGEVAAPEEVVLPPIRPIGTR